MKGDETGRQVELASDLLTCDKAPSPRFADFDSSGWKCAACRPPTSLPQTLAMRLGAMTAKAPVEVVLAPLRLELTPPGPIDLPLGQMMRLAAWAHYSGGRNVQVPGERLKWATDKEAKPAPGSSCGARRWPP